MSVVGTRPWSSFLFLALGASCGPAARGGWYYDVPPRRGTPSRILVCDVSCRSFNMDATAKVDLLFGCATRVIE
jgi:hypothetical protein